MASYSLSATADRDLENLYEYSVLHHGQPQARNYLLGLHGLFEVLAENPRLGTGADWAAPEMRRHPHGEHVVYFTSIPDGILIVRVLHGRMDAERHL